VVIEARVSCPACGEPLSLSVDTSGGREQSYYEDCAVCCRAMAVRVRCRPGRLEALDVEPA